MPRLRRLLTNLLLSLLLGSIALVLLFRFVPVPFTPLMLLRHIEAHQQGRHLEIQHEWTPLEDISPNLIAAVIDHEDAKFYDHRGFDWDAIRCAHKLNQRYGRITCGGSTISQQTAKNIFTFHSRTYLRKAVEAYFTILIEFLWGKERILEVYLNMIEMGDGVFGAEAAADYYFSTSAAGLNRYDANYIAWRLPDPRR
ncbi:MAG: monofunctional biosynthetic peptidoglycan transglycosylase [Alistipes sp.]|nr:monofunctional biosynthetic peptidoglycan transglycosylase [Alistipes sp.]